MAKAKQVQADNTVDDLETEAGAGSAPGGVAPIGDSSADAVAALLAVEEQAEQDAEQDGAAEQDAADAEQEEAEQAARLAGAKFMANMLTGAAAQGVQQVWGVEVGKADQDKVAEKLAPVMAKYGGGMPDWLVPYKEEFELGVVLAGVGVGVYRQVQQRKAETARAVNDDSGQQKAAA